VADPDLRARVARMVEAFTLAYPKCRFVITSRVVGYTGAARLTRLSKNRILSGEDESPTADYSVQRD
jgi:hypothetical protein